MQRFTLVIVLALVIRLAAQEPLPSASPSPPTDLKDHIETEARRSPVVRDLNLLGRASFTRAEEATVTVRVYDRGGMHVDGLTGTAFQLRVNGTMRTIKADEHTNVRLQQPPLVLIVFPPNQQEVHALGLQQARQYFAGLDEELKWKVALLDADGTTTSYTQKRAELLALLNTAAHKTEPLIYSTIVGGLTPSRGGQWLDKAEHAVAQMQPYDGPKMLLAFNRPADEKVDEGRKTLSRDGPEALVYAAISAGTHIYIANVAGPGVVLPGGDASTGELPEPVGPVPYDLQRRTQFPELQHLAYRAAITQMTARYTLGGFANSVAELARIIQRDVDANYRITFALTAADRDHGVPQVEVRLDDSSHRVELVDLSPVGAEVDVHAASQEKMEEMWRATATPVQSPELRILQRVDYFPAKAGLQPILPMSAEVDWLGKEPRPETIHLAEYVQNTALDTPVLRQEVETKLTGRALTWERDGKLTPGRYIWRVVVHDGEGKILASADQRVAVGMPDNPDLPVSSLLVGRSCRPGDSTGLQRRVPGRGAEQEHLTFMVDPLRTDACRLQPSASGAFRQGEVARALVRIYPAGKVAKYPPERWFATFTVRNEHGEAQATRSGQFVVNTGGGYAAEANLPLTQAGPQCVAVSLSGPGLKKALVVSRPIAVIAEAPIR